MNILVSAQAGAQLGSLLVFVAIARWYVAPWLSARGRAEALIALLWLHVFRYVALQVFAAQHEGFPASTDVALEIAIGDVGGAALAFAAIVLLRQRAFAGILVSWILVIETITDTILNIRGGIEEHLMGAATGVVWMILMFFVPAVVVGIGLIAGQLITRRHEALAADRRNHEPFGAGLPQGHT
ncbi:hypothetical protein [Bradyrhizobium sp.]|uniref:hypothetical protein n=1 Tax=Bradyrhizobium sp. TaxID=376 RepID=UPI0025BF564F|nr:hypothetical protein [Bradyrhizobium sp.]